MTYPRRPPKRVLVRPVKVTIFTDYEDSTQRDTFEEVMRPLAASDAMFYWFAPDGQERPYTRFGYYLLSVDPARLREFKEALQGLRARGIKLEEVACSG